MTDSWIILRTPGRHTLRLAESLSEDGYEAWTPVETRTIRIPRANVRRTVKLPIMPSYVFARAQHLIDLLQLADTRTPAHADFSVMHFHDRIPIIAEHHLHSLRSIEARRTPRAKAEPLTPGLSVRVKTEGGSFAGMKGKVERSDEGMTLVCFDRRLTVKIATSLLEQSELGVDRSCLGMAA